MDILPICPLSFVLMSIGFCLVFLRVPPRLQLFAHFGELLAFCRSLKHVLLSHNRNNFHDVVEWFETSQRTHKHAEENIRSTYSIAAAAIIATLRFRRCTRMSRKCTECRRLDACGMVEWSNYPWHNGRPESEPENSTAEEMPVEKLDIHNSSNENFRKK